MNRDNATQRIDAHEMFHQTLNSSKDPERSYALLSALAEGCKQTESASAANIEKLTARLNACKNRRQIFNFLKAIAPDVRAAVEAGHDPKEAILAVTLATIAASHQQPNAVTEGVQKDGEDA